ncbi:unnamed protein product [Candidula unifasciata]|uniref:Cytochrome P450 n=1 Tax=Candidula unifasciata TaxID=100452 RepID=A0A8S3Z2F2_9EUPU|nr:unnamed protein product [Candidula unifasciata]
MMWLILVLVVVVPLLLLFAFNRYMSPNMDTFSKMNIDSPPASGFLGHFGQTFKRGLFLNQLEMYNRYKDKKVYGIYNLGKPILMVRDLDIVKDIMVKHFNSFVDRRVVFEFDPPFKENMLMLKGEHWKHVRSMVSPAFSSGRIKRMSRHVERISQRLVNVLRGKQERNEDIELKNTISHFTLDVIASTAVGLETNTLEDPDNIFANHALNCTVRLSSVYVLLAFMAPRLCNVLRKVGVTLISKKSLQFFADTVDAAMENRKEEGQAGKVNDFVDLLINAEREPGQTDKALTRSEIHGQALVFILGGYDTVATVLSFTLFLLANHPDCCQKLQKELDEKLGNESPNYDNVQSLTYMDMCINESMRMFPPGFLIDRVCTEDTVIQGIPIPKDMVVTTPAYAIHHDPDIWPEPNKFQPERFSPENKESRHPYAFMPFGNGPRNCIGMRLAMVELRVALAYVLKSLTPVTCEKTVYPVTLKKFQLTAEKGLWVKFNARK